MDNWRERVVGQEHGLEAALEGGTQGHAQATGAEEVPTSAEEVQGDPQTPGETNESWDKYNEYALYQAELRSSLMRGTGEC